MDHSLGSLSDPAIIPGDKGYNQMLHDTDSVQPLKGLVRVGVMARPKGRILVDWERRGWKSERGMCTAHKGRAPGNFYSMDSYG